MNVPTHVDVPRVLSDRSPVAADEVIGQRQGCETDSLTEPHRGHFINKHPLLNTHTCSQVAPSKSLALCK